MNVRKPLGVIYHCNKNAWQYGSTWSSFLSHFKAFVDERRRGNVVLLCDNCPAHKPPKFCEWERMTYDDEGMITGAKFDFIHVIFMPPNTTLLIQPMDLEVIYSWKSYWHRLQGESMVAKYHAATLLSAG